MHKTTSANQSLGITLLLVDVAEEDKIGAGGSNSMKPIIMSTKSIRVDYLNSEGTVGAKGFEYQTLDTKKAFNYLRYIFFKALIFYYFDLERHI